MKNVRKQKELVFLDLNDGSTAARLQVVAPSNLLRGYNNSGEIFLMEKQNLS